MDQALKTSLIVGAVLVVLGLGVFATVMTWCHWDFTKLSTVQYVTNTHNIQQPITDISIQTDTADILFGISGDGSCKVVCHESEKQIHQVSVLDGTLTLRLNDQRKWYEHIGISIGHPQITVYLPEQQYNTLVIQAGTADVALPRELSFDTMQITVTTGDVSNFASVARQVAIKTTTGNIFVEDMTAGTLDLSVTTGHVSVSKVTCSADVTIGVSTGKARLTELSCQNLISTGTTGDMDLTNVVASGRFDLARSTGNIRFTRCDAAEITAKASTGDVTGSLLSDKVFITKTSTGRIQVPETATGGPCRISTDTGNIKISIER